MALILKVFTSANQIATTKTVLKAYQKILWVMSKKLEPETAIKLKMNILKILTAKNTKNDMAINLILLLNLIPGVDRFKIKSK